MTITIEIPEEIEERLLALTQERGISVEALVLQHIIDAASTLRQAPEPRLSPAEWERALEDWLDSVPAADRPLPDSAFRRESIYAPDDEFQVASPDRGPWSDHSERRDRGQEPG